MVGNGSALCAPSQHEWVDLTPDVLCPAEIDRWREMGDRFTPFQNDPSEQMTETLRAGIHRGRTDDRTRVVCNDELLGFYSLRKMMVGISNLPGPLYEVAKALRRRKPRPGLLLSSIVRSDETDRGFGQVLVEDVMGVALKDPAVKAIFVQPANPRVDEMWRDDYHFQPVASSEIPDLLYAPVNVDVEDAEPQEP